MRSGPVPAPGRALPRTAAGAARPPEGSGCGPGRRGGWGWDRPGRAETGKEGCPALPRAPGLPEANRRDGPASWAVSARPSRFLGAEDFPIGCVV